MRYLALAVLLFGTVWPISKHALQHATPLWFALNRAGMAAVSAALLLALLRRLRLPARADVPAVLGVGLLQLGGFFALTHIALGVLPAGRTAILSNVTVFWLIPLSVWLLGEKVSALRWGAVALGVLGTAVLMAPWRGQGGDLLGYLLLLGASLSWSVAIIITRLYPPQRPVLELLPWCFALGALLILPLALLLEPGGGIGGPAWPQAAFVGAIAAPIGTWATVEAGRRLPGTIAALGFLLVPALGVLVSALWLGETLGWDVLLGGALIGASVVLAARG